MSTLPPYGGNGAADVSCQSTHNAIREGRVDDPAVDAHVQSCEACEELVAQGGALAASLGAPLPPEDDDAIERLLAGLESENGPKGRFARVSTAGRAAALLAVGALILGAVGAAKVRVDWVSVPFDRWALTSLVFALAAAVVGAILVRPLHRPALKTPIRFGWAAIALILPVAIAVLPEMRTGDAMSMLKGPFWTSAFHCFSFGTLTGAAWVLAALAFERRRRLGTSHIVFLAATGGLIGNLALQIQCAVTLPSHLVAGHGTIGMLWALVFAAIGWMVWRPHPFVPGTNADFR